VLGRGSAWHARSSLWRKNVGAVLKDAIQLTSLAETFVAGYSFLEGGGRHVVGMHRRPDWWLPRQNANPCFRAASVARFRIREVRHSGRRIPEGIEIRAGFPGCCRVVIRRVTNGAPWWQDCVDTSPS
jgi:hypothetical protein